MHKDESVAKLENELVRELEELGLGSGDIMTDEKGHYYNVLSENGNPKEQGYDASYEKEYLADKYQLIWS